MTIAALCPITKAINGPTVVDKINELDSSQFNEAFEIIYENLDKVIEFASRDMTFLHKAAHMLTQADKPYNLWKLFKGVYEIIGLNPVLSHLVYSTDRAKYQQIGEFFSTVMRPAFYKKYAKEIVYVNGSKDTKFLNHAFCYLGLHVISRSRLTYFYDKFTKIKCLHPCGYDVVKYPVRHIYQYNKIHQELIQSLYYVHKGDVIDHIPRFSRFNDLMHDTIMNYAVNIKCPDIRKATIGKFMKYANDSPSTRGEIIHVRKYYIRFVMNALINHRA